ncbi:hypothetical protein B296_00046442, partial [Ensete ventricosum]
TELLFSSQSWGAFLPASEMSRIESAVDRLRSRSRLRGYARFGSPINWVQERYRLSRSNVSRKQITPMPLMPKISPPNLPVDTVTEITPMPLMPKNSPPNVPVDTVTDTPLQLKCHDLIQENLAQGSFRRTRKKVTFDLNVQTHEYVLGDEDPKCPWEDDEATEVIDEERKPHKGQDKSFTKFGSFPCNHRYQTCGSSDDDEGVSEEDEEDYEDCDIDEEEDNEDGNEEASYDFLFSFANDDEPQGVEGGNSPSSSPDRRPILLARGNRRDRRHTVHSVLNPVENVSQWKEVKVRAAPAKKNSTKENVGAEKENQTEPMVKVKKPSKQEAPVEASLSSWLSWSENSTVEGQGPALSNSQDRRNSWFSREERRPVLGDVKQASKVASSPARFPSRSTEGDSNLGCCDCLRTGTVRTTQAFKIP